MSFSQYSKELKNRLSSQVSALQDVVDYDKEPFRGFPAATITPSELENDYETSAENRRIYIFTIRLYEQLGRVLGTVDNTAKERADRVLRTLVDSVITTLDEYFTLGGESLMVEAIPSRWGYEQRENNAMRVAEITVRIHTIINVS